MKLSFEPNSSEFSLINARFLGDAARVAYGSEDDCKKWAAEQGFTCQFFSTPVAAHPDLLWPDTQGFVAQSDQAIVVAFRGTQPKLWQDWVSDFVSHHESWGSSGKVHKGFLTALLSVYGPSHLMPRLLLENPRRPVWIAGHSLGGALAELCAAHAHFLHGVQVQGVYTFGQPRVGDDDFAEAVHTKLGTRIFRFVNDQDIVPRVPFFGMGFRHFGSMLFFDHTFDGSQKFQPQTGVEKLEAALKLAWRSLNFDAAKEALQLAKEAAKSHLPGGSGKSLQQLITEQEREKLKQLLAGKIADHDMINQYLVHLDAAIKHGAAPGR